jgi:hypothetical protein
LGADLEGFPVARRPAQKRPSRKRGATSAADRNPQRELAQPVFAQPVATADPTTFRVDHPSDGPAYKAIDSLNRAHKLAPQPFPAPRGGAEPRLTLETVLGGNSAAVQRILDNGQIVFHSTGDCGSTQGPKTQNEVTDKMQADFESYSFTQNPLSEKENPIFNLLLGDIVYSFGESQYYYDQFYEAYRGYPAPILAVAGNHDGMISPLAHATSLSAFLRNFCASSFEVTPEAGGLSRTAQVQPGVFFTFEAPFLRIFVLYSNTLEDPGVISDAKIGDSQLQFLRAALTRVKTEAYRGAIMLAHHHPPYSAGSRHNWSVQMQAQIDAACEEAGVWPHAVLSGHAHNYQRFTRTRTEDDSQIPYLVCGNGGHNVQRLSTSAAGLRAPQVIQAASQSTDQVILESYDDQNYGYLRVIATSTQLRIEYHPASDGPHTRSPDDFVTVDLGTRKLVHFAASDLGRPKAASAIREMKRA